jgi:hypothetical protein
MKIAREENVLETLLGFGDAAMCAVDEEFAECPRRVNRV